MNEEISEYGPHPTCDGRVRMLAPSETLNAIGTDLAHAISVDAYVYSASPLWIESLLESPLARGTVRLLVDWKHRSELVDLLESHPNLKIRTYPSNRTQHDKTIIVHGPNIIYLMTANQNRGAFQLSKNRFVRIDLPTFYLAVARDFDHDWTRSHRLPGRQRP